MIDSIEEVKIVKIDESIVIQGGQFTLKRKNGDWRKLTVASKWEGKLVGVYWGKRDGVILQFEPRFFSSTDGNKFEMRKGQLFEIPAKDLPSRTDSNNRERLNLFIECIKGREQSEFTPLEWRDGVPVFSQPASKRVEFEDDDFNNELVGAF